MVLCGDVTSQWNVYQTWVKWCNVNNMCWHHTLPLCTYVPAYLCTLYFELIEVLTTSITLDYDSWRGLSVQLGITGLLMEAQAKYFHSPNITAAGWCPLQWQVVGEELKNHHWRQQSDALKCLVNQIIWLVTSMTAATLVHVYLACSLISHFFV